MIIALFVLVLFVSYLVSSWALMLFVGVAHHAWWDVIPTLSYSGAMRMVGVLYVAGIVGALLKAWLGGER